MLRVEDNTAMNKWLQYVPEVRRFDTEAVELGNKVFQETTHVKGSSLLSNGQICGRLYFIVQVIVVLVCPIWLAIIK